MPGPMPYERFDAWKRSHELALAIYAATRNWPRAELYGLTSQIRRAALSAPTNIAEGSAKRGRAEFRRFLDIALGSLSEVAYLLRFARDAGLLPAPAWVALQVQRDRTAMLVWRLARSMAASR
ncbi:MAG: four helix bundle protein [Gemmatimonadales bacterium]